MDKIIGTFTVNYKIIKFSYLVISTQKIYLSLRKKLIQKSTTCSMII
jgi:hypothetical protein